MLTRTTESGEASITPYFSLKRNAIKILESISSLLFPTVCSEMDGVCTSHILTELSLLIKDQLLALGIDEVIAEEDTRLMIGRLPYLKEVLIKDATAIFEGDPAARSVAEVMLCYPGFFATMTYRIAHQLLLLGVPLLPRIMSEYAHEKTGIDIHPGAEIGERLCIDHGTGIVIGETAEIGDGVKIYQGVTLGAKSFARDSSGRLIKGGKRHPTVGRDCIIYAGATILGGDTVIGDGSVIGGNAWLTHSVPAGSIVFYEKKK